MNEVKSHWKSWGLLACTLLLGAGLRAHALPITVTLIATDPAALVGESSGAFTLIRDGGADADLSVNVTVGGTAVNGVDYAPISTTLVIPAGFFAVDVPVQPILDTANRGNKTVILTLQTNAAYRVHSTHGATVKIVDDIFDIPPPTVSLTAPADGSIITAPATITLQAEVSDPDLPVKSVSFYSGDDFLGRVTNSPYTLVLNNVHAGNFTYFARAVDEFDKSAISEPVHVQVANGPVVTLTSDGTTIPQGSSETLQALIGDPNEQISSVSFYIGSKLLGTVTSAPFQFNWQSVNTGTFNFHAVATDKNTGKKGTSPVYQLTVAPNGGA